MSIPSVLRTLAPTSSWPTYEWLCSCLEAAGHTLVPVPTCEWDDQPRIRTARDVVVPAVALAMHIDSVTEPGEVILVPDGGGIGAVAALLQWSRPARERRTVLVTAGDSLAMELLAIAGTVDGVPQQIADQIDWEVAGLRAAAAVLVPSARAADAVRSIVSRARIVGVNPSPAAARAPARGDRVHFAEPVSRLAGSDVMVRSLHEEPTIPIQRVTIAADDTADLVWTGTTFEALLSTLAGELQRGPIPAGTDVTSVLGHPFQPPPSAVWSAVAQGGAVAPRRGSVGAGCWPGVPTWEDAADLAKLLSGATEDLPVAESNAIGASAEREADDSRAARVSVGVPVFEDVRFLGDLFATLLAQGQPIHEIVVVDDGSTSATVRDTLRYWQDRLGELLKIVHQPNRGVSTARNTALELFTGDAFVFVDQDDELASDFVMRCAEVMRADTSVTAVATWTEFFGTYEGVEPKAPFDRRTGRRENTIVSTCVLVDMAVRDAGIRFDPDLSWIYCEDWDFWSRIVAAGGMFGLVPEPLARHRVHPASGGHRRTDLALALGKARATSHLDSIDPGGPLAPPVTAP